MSTRHPLPGGQWAELLDPDDLSGADQDAFFDKYDELMAGVPQPEPKPDPANPAVSLPTPPRVLGRAGTRALRDWVLARAVTGWSLDLPLPYQPGYREARGGDGRPAVPLRALNALVTAARPLEAALLDAEDDEDGEEDGPKSGPVSGSDGSTGTSPDGSPSPLPAPPAVQSGTP